MNISNEEYRYLQDTATLTDALFQQKNMQSIVNLAYRVFGNPVFILDLNFRLICKSDTDVDDDVWHDLSENGYFSYNSLKLSKKEKRYEAAINNRLPVIFSVHEETAEKLTDIETDCEVLSLSDENIKYSRLIVNLFDKTTPIGSVAVLEVDTPFEEYHIKLAQFFAKLLVIRLKQDPQIMQPSGEPLENFYRDLIAGNIKSEKVLQERLIFYGHHPRSYFMVTAIGFRDSSNDPAELNPYRTTLTEKFHPICSLISNNSILFVFNSDTLHVVSDKVRREFSRVLQENQLYAGESESFDTLMEFRTHANNATRAKDLCVKYYENKHVLKSSDCVMLDIADVVRTQYPDPDDFCHPAVKKLIAFDNEHGTHYVPTLLAYLDNINNLQAASQALSIHRNSLTYRLNKIEEITGINVADMQIAFHLYISFMIKGYMPDA